MRILLTGANGFIGSNLLAALLEDGHDVVAAVRAPEKLKQRFPAVDARRADLNDMTTPEHWQPLLAGVGAIINCAGVLQSRGGQNAEAIHATAPIALFTAAQALTSVKVIQISAVGEMADTEFARTKRKADDFLATTELDWTILRPSIVYGHQAYGGTAMLRALAATPFALPVIGDGAQLTTPIHVADLARTVSQVLQGQSLSRQFIYPCGPATLTLAQVTATYRSWLGLPAARTLSVPLGLIRLAGKLGDVFGTGPITTTSIRQLEHGTQCDPAAFRAVASFEPRAMSEALQSAPAGTADLWHARLYLLRPAIRQCLVVLWLVSALSGFLAAPDFARGFLAFWPALAEQHGLVALATSLLDLFIAAALLFNWKPKAIAVLQLGVVAGYTAFLTAAAPGLWLAPFGELLKNLPVLALILVHMILSEER